MNDAELLSVVFVAVILAFYLMFLRPIQKDQEKHRQQIRDLRVGDEVLTTSNFVATIRDIQVPERGDSRITLEIAEGVRVTALPAAILQRLTPAPAEGAPNAGPGPTATPSSGARPGESSSETGQAQA